VLVQEPFPDVRDGQAGLSGEHGRDRLVQPVEGVASQGHLPAWRRRWVGQGLADRAAVHLMAGGESTDGVPVLPVTADRGEQAWLVRVPGHAPGWLPARLPGQAGEGAVKDGDGAAGHGGEPFRLDSVQVGRRPGEVAVQVAGPQVVGDGQPPDITAD